MAEKSRSLLNARAVRRTIEVEVDLGDGTFVRALKRDMTMLLFEGRLPMPLLVAVQKMIEMPNATPSQRVAALGPDNALALIELLRKHAVDVVIQPKISLTESGDPDVLPASYLDTTKLLAIWQATAIVPLVGASAAAEFRGGAGADAADDARPSEDLRTLTEFVDLPGHEFIRTS